MANEGRKNNDLKREVQELADKVHRLEASAEQVAIYETANQRLKADLDALTQEYLRLLAELKKSPLADPHPAPSSTHTQLQDDDTAFVEAYKQVCQDLLSSGDSKLVQAVTVAVVAKQPTDPPLSPETKSTIATNCIKLLQQLILHLRTAMKQAPSQGLAQDRTQESSTPLVEPVPKLDDDLTQERSNVPMASSAQSYAEAGCQTVLTSTLIEIRTRP